MTRFVPILYPTAELDRLRDTSIPWVFPHAEETREAALRRLRRELEYDVVSDRLPLSAVILTIANGKLTGLEVVEPRQGNPTVAPDPCPPPPPRPYDRTKPPRARVVADVDAGAVELDTQVLADAAAEPDQLDDATRRLLVRQVTAERLRYPEADTVALVADGKVYVSHSRTPAESITQARQKPGLTQAQGLVFPRLAPLDATERRASLERVQSRYADRAGTARLLRDDTATRSWRGHEVEVAQLVAPLFVSGADGVQQVAVRYALVPVDAVRDAEARNPLAELIASGKAWSSFAVAPSASVLVGPPVLDDDGSTQSPLALQVALLVRQRDPRAYELAVADALEARNPFYPVGLRGIDPQGRLLVRLVEQERGATAKRSPAVVTQPVVAPSVERPPPQAARRGRPSAAQQEARQLARVVPPTETAARTQKWPLLVLSALSGGTQSEGSLRRGVTSVLRDMVEPLLAAHVIGQGDVTPEGLVEVGKATELARVILASLRPDVRVPDDLEAWLDLVGAHLLLADREADPSWQLSLVEPVRTAIALLSTVGDEGLQARVAAMVAAGDPLLAHLEANPITASIAEWIQSTRSAPEVAAAAARRYLSSVVAVTRSPRLRSGLPARLDLDEGGETPDAIIARSLRVPDLSALVEAGGPVAYLLRARASNPESAVLVGVYAPRRVQDVPSWISSRAPQLRARNPFGSSRYLTLVDGATQGRLARLANQGPIGVPLRNGLVVVVQPLGARATNPDWGMVALGLARLVVSMQTVLRGLPDAGARAENPGLGWISRLAYIIVGLAGGAASLGEVDRALASSDDTFGLSDLDLSTLR